MHRGYRGKGGNTSDRQFRQPDFTRQNGVGRGSNMTAPAWQTRDGPGACFGSFDGAGAGDRYRQSHQYGQDREYAPGHYIDFL